MLEAPINVAQVEWDEWNRIKPNQTKSNQNKPVSGKCLWHNELHCNRVGFGGDLGAGLGL
jgi:hypothetical protein